MPIACDAGSLMESAKCLEGCLSDEQLDAIIVWLLCQWANQ